MPTYLSREGLDKLKQELAERKGSNRTEITRKILAAKELGDLSENAEYIEAKEAQSFNEGRVAELEEIIKEAVVIQNGHQHDIVTVGATVKVQSPRGEHQFTIVGPAESDPARGFISNESPLGSAFIGRKKGERVEVKTPAGISQYQILDIK